MTDAYASVVDALANVLDAFDGFAEFLDAPGDEDIGSELLARLNNMRAHGRKILDEIGAYDDQKRN